MVTDYSQAVQIFLAARQANEFYDWMALVGLTLSEHGFEDDGDYLIAFEETSTYDPRMVPLGTSSFFVRKADGQLWSRNPFFLREKIDKMTPTEP